MDSWAGKHIWDQFVQGGCRSGTFDYPSGRAWFDTLVNPVTADWFGTPAQVGGFGGAQITNNGDGTAHVQINNNAGSNSFVYHAVPNRTSSTGPMRTIHQQFNWTASTPLGCR